MIALFNVMLHPEAYACAYAGGPVSDLLQRRKYLKSMPARSPEARVRRHLVGIISIGSIRSWRASRGRKSTRS